MNFDRKIESPHSSDSEGRFLARHQNVDKVFVPPRALEPVSVNAVGAGSGWHGRYAPGRKAICIPGRPRLEEHGGMGARPKGVRFLCAVAARAE